MAKLNQIIAIEKGVKSRTASTITQLYHALQKNELFNGLSKEYQPVDDTGEKLPPESIKVQLTYTEILKHAEKAWSDLFQITARKDFTNSSAKANLSVEGSILLADVPVTTLLFLEKNLVDIRTFIEKLPVLDSSQDWNYDANSGTHKTKEIQTHRTKKIEKTVVLLAPTPEHPGQAVLRPEDVLVGYWNIVKLSGAITITQKTNMLNRIDTLSKAVKIAREEANMVEETKTPEIGEAIFSYVLGS
jgi:hypothetical protein